MVFSNADKQQHGQSAMSGLESILNNSKDYKYLTSNFISNFRLSA